MIQEYTLGVARWPELAARERGMTLAEYLAWEREKNLAMAVTVSSADRAKALWPTFPGIEA